MDYRSTRVRRRCFVLGSTRSSQYEGSEEMFCSRKHEIIAVRGFGGGEAQGFVLGIEEVMGWRQLKCSWLCVT